MNVLGSVSCSTANFCAALTWQGNVLTYDGSSWSSPDNVNPAGGQSVSCPTTTFCAEVGYNGDFLTYDGSSWSSPDNIDPSGGGLLQSISCPTTTFCAAVDDNGNVLTYDGSSWTPPESIDPGTNLNSVSCPMPNFCAAVDQSGNVVAYDGSSWSLPESIDGLNFLSSVSCPTPTFCAAVDQSGNVLAYDGSSWSPPGEIDPDLGGLDNGDFISISCPTATFCAAVDEYGNFLTYDGSSWSSPERIETALNYISCPTASFCVLAQGEVLTYDGGSWSLSATTNGGGGSISCPSTSFCMATVNVFFGQPASGGVSTYDGSSWSSPQSNIDPLGGLQAISCASASFCAAVDWHGYVFSYSPSAPALSKTAIASVSANPLIGQPVSVGVQVTGPTTTAGSPTPTGLVTVTDGAQSCEARLSGSNGTATGTCSITEHAAGNYSLAASYPGDDNFNSSETSTSTPFTVSKATPTISWAPPAALTYGTALGAAQLDATANVPGTFVYSPPVGTVLKAGAGQVLAVTFAPADSTDYTGASAITTITVNQAAPVITWNQPSPITYGTALGAAQLDATANVPGTFVYSPPAGTVLPLGANQTLSVTFTPVDTTDYTTAPATTTITTTVPPCPSGTGVNFRWHYEYNGSSGSWSGTTTEVCPRSFSMGPQAMEGNLKVVPGQTLYAGYDFTVPGNKKALTVTVSQPSVTFSVGCASGATPSASRFTVTMPTASYPVSDSQWYPTGNQSSSLSYEGSVSVPNLCSGGDLTLSQGGTFSATVG